MREITDTIEKVAPTDANTLILGENGTGKEVVAREIHRKSARNREVFAGVEAWQKLIRVLRHEIMNSITPITTLTVAMKRILHNKTLTSQTANDTELTKDLLTSIDLIEDRGRRLIQFVDTYRDITSLPSPEFEEIPVERLIRKVCGLFYEQCREQEIELENRVLDTGMHIRANASMMEQVETLFSLRLPSV